MAEGSHSSEPHADATVPYPYSVHNDCVVTLVTPSDITTADDNGAVVVPQGLAKERA